MSSKPEPAIWSRDTGQRIFWYDSCQLNIIWMSNIKDICFNPCKTVYLVLAWWPPCCATSSFVVVGRTRPWSMPLAIFTMGKELHGFLISMHTSDSVPTVMGLGWAALPAAGAPLLWVIVVPQGVSAWKEETAQARAFALPLSLLLNHP